MDHINNEPELYRQIEDLQQKVVDLETQLRESEDKFRALTDSAPVGIFLDDAQGEAVFINKKCAELVGVPAEEALNFNWISLLHPDDREQMVSNWKKAFHNSSEFHMVYRWVHQDGRIVWTLGEVIPIMGDNGKATMYIGTLTDITAQKQAEIERENLQTQLVHAQKMDSIGQLAGGIAHDFNNQLSGILGYADLIALNLKDEKLKQYAEKICQAVENGSKLTKQLLSFARKGQYTMEPIDLNDICDEVIGILEHTIDKQIQIKQEKKLPHLTVRGDRNQIQNALLNIALNARDAINGKGNILFESSIMEIEKKQNNSNIDLDPGIYASLKIKDDGCGMDESVREHIFDPFFTTKDVGKGTGMGLSSAYGAVEQHGGGIFVESIPGTGSTFQIILPLSPSMTMEKERIDSKITYEKVGRARILLIDDDKPIRDLVTEFLEGLGYQVHTEADGNSGLNYFREYHGEIDLVIMDMIMPEKGGVELYSEIREIQPETRILLSSGYGSQKDSILDLIQQGTPFLQKPISLKDLSDRVAEIMQESK